MGASVAAGTRLGRYEVVKHLASGTMADLLLARAGGLEGFERYVVIKRIRADSEEDPGFVAMFLAEARLAAVLHHHNIVQVNDIGEVDGKPYFTMEYVHGHDLRHLLAHVRGRREQIPLQHVITIVAAVATALHHAHEQKGPDGSPLDIVHRDVTPANVLVGFDGNVKVVDFGLARAALRRSETQAGMLRGKAPYMAPEQCTGGRIDRRSDVFALGVVLYELATARRLFKGDNEFYTMAAIVNGTVPPPSTVRADLPPLLDTIVLRALARDPAARFQTAEQLFNALDALAVRSALRTSSTALAAYLKLQFGEPAEPWLANAPARPVIGVDWDGHQPGLVAPPDGPAPSADAEGSPLDLEQPTMVSAFDDVHEEGSASMSTRKPDAVHIPTSQPAGEPGAAARSATPTPVRTVGGRQKPKTIQIPVSKIPDARDSTQVLANPLAVAVPPRAATIEPDDDAQLPKTRVVANPLAAAPAADPSGPQSTRVVANPLVAAERFGARTDVLAVPLAEPPAAATGPKPLRSLVARPVAAAASAASTSGAVRAPGTTSAGAATSSAGAAGASAGAAGASAGAAGALVGAATARRPLPGVTPVAGTARPAPAKAASAAVTPTTATVPPTTATVPPTAITAAAVVPPAARGAVEQAAAAADAPVAAAADAPVRSPRASGLATATTELQEAVGPAADEDDGVPVEIGGGGGMAPAPVEARASTEVDEQTSIGTPPAPIPVAAVPLVIAAEAASKAAADATAIVKPLPPPPAAGGAERDAEADADRHAEADDKADEPDQAAGVRVTATASVRGLARRRWPLIAAAVGGLAVVAGIVIAMTGGDAPIAPVPTASTEPAASAEPRIAAGGTTDEAAPRAARTWGNSDKPVEGEAGSAAASPEPTEGAPTEGAPTEGAPTEGAPTDAAAPAPTAVAAPEIEIEPAPPARPPPTRKPPPRVATKPPRATTKPPARPAARPRSTKPPKPPAPASSPGWDPNSLFPKKK